MSHFPSVTEVNGRLSPGRIHTLIISNTPLKRAYKRHGNHMFDSNLKDVGTELLTILSKYAPSYVSLRRNNIIEGRSWEMAAIHGFLGVPGIYSGVINHIHRNRIHFGPVMGVGVKRELGNFLTYENIPSVDFPGQ